MNRRVLALILLCGALALPALPVHADATDDLFEAVKNGTASEVKAALAAGADPGARARAGMTPLHFAAAKKNPNPSVTKALIEAGADPDARLDNGVGWPGGMSTPLHIAAIFNPSVITALIEGGANPDARNEDGDTPLHFAAKNPNPSVITAVITALIEGGADPAARNEDSDTPLHIAAAWRDANPSVITALIEGGANPDARDEDGDTPLHRVAARIEDRAFLARSGVTVDDLSVFGDSVFGDTGDDLSVILALLRAGADPGARNERGMTPFDYVKDNEALKGTGVYRLLNPAAGAGAAAWAPAWAVRGPWARDRPGPCAKKRGASAWRRSPACMASSWRRSSASRCWSRMPARSLLARAMVRTPCHMPTATTEAAMAETTEAAALMTAGSIMAGAVRSS